MKEANAGRAEVGSCLTDATPEATPGVPFVGCRYAEARPLATAVAAAIVIGGVMQALISASFAFELPIDLSFLVR